MGPRFLKVIGRDTFLIGEHRVVDYECVRETLMLGAVPQLMVVQGGDSIDWTNHTNNITQKRDHPFCCFNVHMYSRVSNGHLYDRSASHKILTGPKILTMVYGTTSHLPVFDRF